MIYHKSKEKKISVKIFYRNVINLLENYSFRKYNKIFILEYNTNIINILIKFSSNRIFSINKFFFLILQLV